MARFLSFLFVLLILAACGDSTPPPVFTPAYTPPATPGGRLCINQCREAQDFCRQDCGLTHRACIGDVQAKALRDYDAYARDHLTAHLSVDLHPSNFENNNACNAAKAHCEKRCESVYIKCYRNCGGTVTVPDSCQFMCF